MSSGSGSKILILQNDDNFCLDVDHWTHSNHFTVHHTAHVYQTVRALTNCQASQVLVAGTFKALSVEKLNFFRILNSHADWRCCCLIHDAQVPVHAVFQPLISRHRLLFMQTKPAIVEYITAFLDSELEMSQVPCSAGDLSNRKVQGDEFLLTPEELQALLSVS